MRSLRNRENVVALREEAQAGDWNNTAGVELLHEAQRVIRPVVRNTALRHRVRPEELESATLEAAWQALVRYEPSRSPDPWGWVAQAARRAAGDAAAALQTGQQARNRARLAAALAATQHRLVNELGRKPRRKEVIAGLTPGMRALAARVGADRDPAAFVAVAAPMLTYDDRILDRPAPSGFAHETRRGWRLISLAERLAEELDWPTGEAEDTLLLAADVLADLIPTAGLPDAARRAVGELMHSPVSGCRDRATARRVVESLLARFGTAEPTESNAA